MKNTLTYKVVFGCVFTLINLPIFAQQTSLPVSMKTENHQDRKKAENYQELKNLGYTDSEIFEDLGNASFLAENYGTALYWYGKLREISEGQKLSSGFQKRYMYAEAQLGTAGIYNDLDPKDWLAVIREDYQLKQKNSEMSLVAANSKYKPLNLQPDREQIAIKELVHYEKVDATGVTATKGKNRYTQNNYKAPIALTADGNTAYYSKAVYVKPEYGIFSKKELVHKIYKAEKVNGEWNSVSELRVCPKNYSALHPTVSSDGSRLFFASNMPGTYGEFDIYMVNLNSNGTHSVAKNLGKKVNTKENDLYPNMVGDNTLFFASEGHDGYGGLDVFMTQVDQKNVGLAVNMGSPINSMEDDYSIFLRAEKGDGYVMSNRGKDQDTIQQVTFSYASMKPGISEEIRKFDILEALNGDSRIDYSSSVFEDQ